MTTTLPGTVTSAPVGARGADMLSKLTADNVQTLVQNGYSFCVRYVPLPGYPAELTTEEAQLILDGGLALMVVQRARNGSVTAEQGTDDGEAAVSSCQSIGLPNGVNVWLDLESISGDVFNYANSWYTQVLNAKYAPGVYIGANIVNDGSAVTSSQLYSNLKFQHYWRSLSNVPNVDNRGYQMYQLFPTQTLTGGLEVDVDFTQEDYEHGQVQWLSPLPAGAPAQEVAAASARTRRVRT